MKKILFFIIVSISSPAFAMEKIEIPGAHCGNGAGYSIFIRKGDPEKIVIHLQGGGACWDYASCFGLVKMAFLEPREIDAPGEAIKSIDSKVSPVSDFTYIFLPYCTGDLWVGTHIVNYESGHRKKRVRHVGYRNLNFIFKQLIADELIDLNLITNIVLYGHSAGAMGVLFNLEFFNNYFSNIKYKTAVLDSPGLHFGDKFVTQFSQPLQNDLHRSFSEVGLSFDGSGFFAKTFSNVCENYPGWTIGVLQGGRDFVTSIIFGHETMKEQEALVYGPKGIYEETKSLDDRCSAWVPNVMQHVFLKQNGTMNIQTSDGKKAMDYLRDIVDQNKTDFPNYR